MNQIFNLGNRDLNVTHVSGNFSTVLWGDRPIQIHQNIKSKLHTFTAALDFNGMYEENFEFTSNLCICKITQDSQTFPMLCLQIICAHNDMFLWIPHTKLNYQRVLNLISIFTQVVFELVVHEGRSFSLQTILIAALDEVAHFEKLKFKQLPEELEEFDRETDIEEILYPFTEKLIRKKTPPRIVAPNTDLSIPQTLYHRDGSKKSDAYLEQEYEERLNLMAQRLEMADLLGTDITDEEYLAVQQNNFIKVRDCP